MSMVLARITRRFNRASGNVELYGYEDVPDTIHVGWQLKFPDGGKATVREIAFQILPRDFGGERPVLYHLGMHSEPPDDFKTVMAMGRYNPVEAA